jgi:diguanylate cyclase (GGDEF)-like protein
MRRLLHWLIPEFALISEKDRVTHTRALVAAWFGALGLALVVTLVEMGLDALTPDDVRVFLRPVVFTLVTLTCTALVMRVSYRESAKSYREQAQLNQALEHQALFDGLTDLPNRGQFHDRLQRSLDGSRVGDAGFALMVVDLDDFKNVNDTLGHVVGDLLLQEVARRLLGVLRPQDMVARVGGDEFVVILAGEQEESSRAVARRLLEALGVSVLLDGHQVRVTASIGIAVCPTHGTTADPLLRHGDLAMYAAKRAGGTYAVYAPEMEPAELPTAA